MNSVQTRKKGIFMKRLLDTEVLEDIPYFQILHKLMAEVFEELIAECDARHYDWLKKIQEINELNSPDEYVKADARCKVYLRALIAMKKEYAEWREEEEAEYGDDLKAKWGRDSNGHFVKKKSGR